jgi:hypothetical protein
MNENEIERMRANEQTNEPMNYTERMLSSEATKRANVFEQLQTNEQPTTSERASGYS